MLAPPPGVTPHAMPRVVKRYANRKLYDTTDSRYVALDDIAAMVRRGEDVEVTDNESGSDLTAVTFAQIILEEERRKSDYVSLPLLRELIRFGGGALAGAIGEIRGLAEKSVSGIVGDAPGRRPALLEEVIANSRRRLEDLQHRMDDGFRHSLERVRNHPTLAREIERLEDGLKAIESRVASLVAGGAPAGAEGDPGTDTVPPVGAAGESDAARSNGTSGRGTPPSSASG